MRMAAPLENDFAAAPVAKVTLEYGDSLTKYHYWPQPTVILSDGAYGISGFPGDLDSPAKLAEWYEPHIKVWSEAATLETTLWFWNTEVGWATVHPILERYGWVYRGCNIWNKGIGHIAGNANTRTLRRFPAVTEICAHYVRRSEVKLSDGVQSMKHWLRSEWKRTGLPLYLTNVACGVANAATRKYFTDCHLWYFPPKDMFEKFSEYANNHGDPSGRPYFSLDGIEPISSEKWERMRAIFRLPIGKTNVWDIPALRDKERLKTSNKSIHLNQKPIEIIKMLIEVSSDNKDVVWEPFGGLATGAICSLMLERSCFSAEIDYAVYEIALKRLEGFQSRLL